MSPSEDKSNLLIRESQIAALKQEALSLPSIDLQWHQICDLEMLMNGAYAPLQHYLGREDYESVLENLCLKNGVAWSLPLTLRVSEKQAGSFQIGSRIALRDGEGFLLAVLTLTDRWASDLARDQSLLEKSAHPQGVALQADVWHLGGSIEGVSLPMHHDFADLRITPETLRTQFIQRGWHQVIGWLGTQPMHKAQFEFCLRAANEAQANLLLLPFGGGDLATQPGYFTLLRTYQALLPRFPALMTRLVMLPAKSHDGGLREKYMRLVLARNYGCTQVIIEADSGDVTKQSQPNFDLDAEAQKLGVTVVRMPMLRYVEDVAEFLPESELSGETRTRELPDVVFQQLMQAGQNIPEWFAFPEVIAEMRRANPPRAQQGFTVFFTGLSGAGKSTLAKAMAVRLMEMGERPVTLLDGDIVRQHLSSELGFSRKHRDINVRRIGFVASEITKNRGVAICAPIAPYRQTRRDVRAMIEAAGGFIEVHVSTSIETCESRDRKGLYAKARAGLIPEFTGISDPYETPEKPELALDTAILSVDEAVQHILLKLRHEGYLR